MYLFFFLIIFQSVMFNNDFSLEYLSICIAEKDQKILYICAYFIPVFVFSFQMND